MAKRNVEGAENEIPRGAPTNQTSPELPRGVRGKAQAENHSSMYYYFQRVHDYNILHSFWLSSESCLGKHPLGLYRGVVDKHCLYNHFHNETLEIHVGCTPRKQTEFCLNANI